MDAVDPLLSQKINGVANAMRALLERTRQEPSSPRAAGPKTPPASGGFGPAETNLGRTVRRRMALLVASLAVAAVAAFLIWRYRQLNVIADRRSDLPKPQHEHVALSIGQARMNKRFDLMNSSGLRLLRIDPGVFLMGSPPGEPGQGSDERQHEVRLTVPFLISIEEVTRVNLASS